MGANIRVDSAHDSSADLATTPRVKSLAAKGIPPTSCSTERHVRGSTTRLDIRTPLDRSSIGTDFEFCSATEADHDEIHRFLVSVFQRPSPAEFQHSLEAPRYEPLDRLLFRRQDEIVAHVQLRHHSLQFGELVIPTIDIRHLATLPEYRGLGLASRLLQAIEHDTNLHGAMLATVRAEPSEFFAHQGWVPWLSSCHSTASPRALISQLESVPVPTPEWCPSPKTEMVIRRWRRNELDALRRLYAEEAHSLFGGLARDEADWQWLVSGNGCDHIYVALQNPAQLSIDDLSSQHINGYAVIKEGRIVELMARRDTDAARQLLIRVSHDAIESGRHSVEIDAAPDSPDHLPFLAAGGRCYRRPQDNQRAFMAKLLRPDELLQKLRPVLAARAKQASQTLPSQLGIQIGLRRFSIQLGRRQATIAEGKLADPHITLEAAAYNCMLLGQFRVRQLIEAGQVTPSSQDAARLADALFPRLPTWRMPWEDLPARAIR